MINDSLRDVIEDPDFTQPATLYRGGSSDVDSDAEAELSFDPPEQIEILVARPDAETFGLAPGGTDDDVSYMAAAMLDQNITDEDRLVLDTGFGEQPYRVAEPEVTQFDGDQFAWYRLYEDTRGEAGGSSGDDSDMIR